MQFPHPIHLTADVDLSAKAEGVGPNTIALRNPNGDMPMEIHEITFDIKSEGVITGGSVAAQLVMGNYELTNGYVPVWNFGKSRSTDREIAYGGDTANYGSFTWRLPRPLYVPAGAVIQPLFQHRGMVTEDINARINLRGSALQAGYRPEKLFLPFVCSYTSKPFDLDAAESDESSETDISNPFDSVLKIQRMIGRVSVDIDETSEKSEISDPSVAMRLIQAQIFDSRGRPVVRDYAYFSQVFARQTRSWDLDGAKMDPGDFYSIRLKKLAPPNGSAVTAATRYAIANVSLVGWREVRG